MNADVSGGDAKQMVYDAKAQGFTLMLPDMKAGMSMDSVVERLILMNEVDADYSGIIFIFDTLKKMTDVINKTRAKELYKTLRGLSAKGMTIALLCHTNKYTDSDGKPIFEGTGDLRTDVDELIYLIPKKNDDGSMTVSTNPDKVRGAFEPITFEISPDRKVTQAEYVDVLKIKKATWRQIVDIVPARVLANSDVLIVEIAACLLAEYRANPNEMVTARIIRLTAELGKLGLSPSDRAGLEVYKPENEYNQFDEF